MRYLILILILNITAFGVIPKSVDNIIVKLKKAEVSVNSTKNIFERSKIKNGVVSIGNSKFDGLSKEFKFKNLKRGFSIKKENSDTNSKRMRIYKRMDLGNVLKINLEKNNDVKGLIKKLENSGLFEYVAVPEKVSINVVPNDTRYDYQWGKESYNSSYSKTDAIEKADLDMESAWDITTGSSSTVVAILDTGNKKDHPDFEGRIWENNGEIPDNGVDDDGNGKIDDYYGWDFAYDDNIIDDKEGHGTHVTGIIGANGNNSKNIAGMDWNAKLMTIKVLDDNGNGNTSMWHDGIIYAVDNGANVINMSLGGQVDNQGTIDYIQEAVTYAYENGVVILVSSGNDNSGESNYYPACCDSLLCVGSTNDKAERSSFSNYGSHLDVVAPGEFIWSLKYDDTSYASIIGKSGTSQASPHVAGLVSLIMGYNPSLTPAKIFNIVRSTATDEVGDPSEDTPGYDDYYGFGLINPVAALQMADTTKNSIPTILSQSKSISLNEDDSLLIVLNDINANDEDGDSLTLIVTSGTHYIVVNNKIFPNTNYNGPLTVPVKVSDGIDESELFDLSVTVTAVNDAPKIISQDSSKTIMQDSSLELRLEYISTYDVEDSSLYLVVKSGINYSYVGNTITPDSDFFGDLDVNIVVNDGEIESDNFIFNVTVEEMATTILNFIPTNQINSKNLVIAPMPFVNSAKAYYNSENSGFVDFFIYTSSGKLLYKITREVKVGKNILDLEGISKLTKGFYYIVLKLDGEIKIIKRVVKA